MSWNVKDMSNEGLADLLKNIREEVEARQSKWARYIAYLRAWADDKAGVAYAGQSPLSYDEWRDKEKFLEEDYLRANS